MKAAKRVVLAGFLLAIFSSVLEAQTILPIVDTSSAGSPIVRSGTVELTEATSDGRSAISYEIHRSVKNASNKQIVALIESFLLEYPNNVKIGATERYELFFHSKLMQPGETVNFDKTSSQVRVEQTSSGRVYPKCEVATLWVQFDDGTSFGDARYAVPLLKDRNASLNAMLRLRDLYQQQGSDRFIAELKSPSIPNGASLYEMYMEELRGQLATTQDAEGTFRKLQAYLSAAGNRSALLGTEVIEQAAASPTVQEKLQRSSSKRSSLDALK